MSEPQLVSPLLDGFIIGEAISDHHGVRCCPAIQENTDERYIVKIISIPASQIQLDALLLTGAYSDQAQALAYFKELADGVIGEADIIDRLSRMEGFISYQGYQIRQMPEGVGYDVYLLSPYRKSLKKLMRTEPLTHLSAVNLGLDMCAALAVCRRAGFLYADLKPSNIFRSETQGYHIGDLGFISLSSLKYASLPEKYRSPYTAPEISDALSTLNDTIDIYALGLTLYQVYNNGELPFEGNAPAQLLPPPLYADYEMAEIILKACAPNPWERWQDPAQMGQALVNYMQRNSINDTPIVPPPVVINDEPEEPEAFLTEEENDAELAELLAMIPDEEPPVAEPDSSAPNDGEDVQNEDSTENLPSEEASGEPEPQPESVSGDTPEDFDQLEQLSFLDDDQTDETAPSEEDAVGLTDTQVTSEVAQMLAQADDLISHELPEPVVVPDPIDIPIPPPIQLESETEEEPTEDTTDEDDLPEDGEQSPAEPEEMIPDPFYDEEETDEPFHYSHHSRSRRIMRHCIAATVILLLLAASAIGVNYWYQAYYLQPVHSLEISGTAEELQVFIVSDVDETLLTVYCTDVYGNARNSAVTDGIAVFTDLTPGTQYRIHVEISGLKKLTGKTTGTYTTTDVTNILNFSANRGPEDGSVVLSFSTDGPDVEGWIVEYYTGLDTLPHRKAFTGHTVTINGLTVDRKYTFRLMAAEDVPLSGTCELVYTPTKIVCAQELRVIACGGGSMTVAWTLPESTTAQNWLVRCYNDAGFDQSLTTTETTAQFTGLDHATGYIVTVTAEGMPKSVSTTVSPDPITINSFHAEVKDPWAMTLSWDYTGTAPVNGWLLSYTIDGGDLVIVNCGENSVIIPLVPNCTYTFEVSPVDEITCFALPFTYGPVQTPVFEGYYVTAENMTFTMYLGATEQNTFAAGEQATLKGALNCQYGESDDTIVSTFVIRSTDNALISAETCTCSWKKLWKKRACTLDIPALPTQAGTYMLDLYFNEMFVATLSFTIT